MAIHHDEIMQALLHYRTVLVRSCLLITRDCLASDDIYQNLVIKAHNANLEFESTSSLLAWCRTVIRSEGVEWLRKNGRELTLDETRLLDLLDAEHDEELKESQNLTAWSEMLSDCLAKLSGESRKLINLRYDGNRNCDEVARLMEISLDTVYKRLSRIHQKLRNCVNSKANHGSISGGARQ